MAWLKVDDQFAFHPKALQAGNRALGLWLRAGAWCMQQLTDGVVPDSMVIALGGNQGDARALVTAGLWVEVAGGYEFHDWAHWQRSKEQILSERVAAQERMATHRAKKTEPREPRKRGERIPEPFLVTPDMRQWAATEVPLVNVDDATRRFVDYWRAASGQTASKRDWTAAWRNWLRKDNDTASQRPLTPMQRAAQTAAAGREVAGRHIQTLELEAP